jgi:hypothetical protein
MVDIVIVRSNFVEPMGVVDEVLNLHVYCVADPGFFNPRIRGIRDGKKTQSQHWGSRMNITDLSLENLISVFGLKILKFFDADPDLGSCQPWIQDGTNRIRDSGSGINIPDPQHCIHICRGIYCIYAGSSKN